MLDFTGLKRGNEQGIMQADEQQNSIDHGWILSLCEQVFIEPVGVFLGLFYFCFYVCG